MSLRGRGILDCRIAKKSKGKKRKRQWSSQRPDRSFGEDSGEDSGECTVSLSDQDPPRTQRSSVAASLAAFIPLSNHSDELNAEDCRFDEICFEAQAYLVQVFGTLIIDTKVWSSFF